MSGRPPTLRRASQGARRGGGARPAWYPALATQYSPPSWMRLLAFAAALIALRLSGDLARRWRARKRPELAAWAGGLATYALAAGALAWGSAAGWSDACLSRLLPRRSASHRGAPRRRLVAAGRSTLGCAAGAGVHRTGARCRRGGAAWQESLSGTEIPDAQDVLDFWPARVLAILGNSLGTLAVVVVALATFRSRPRGNVLILAGIAVAAIGSGLAGLGVGALAPAIAVAAVLLYAGFVAPSPLAKPHPPSTATTASASAASTIAPGVPPCATRPTSRASGSTSHRACTAPSARASVAAPREPSAVP